MVARREGLKILWPLRLCGFKSRFEYSIRDCNLNCVSKEKNIIFTNTVFL